MAYEDFKAGFVECAMWLGKHFETEADFVEGEGEGLRDCYDASEIPANVMEEIESDCRAFYDNYAHLWADEDSYSDEDAGGDFFLTRNRHGAVFWDRGLENGEELTDAAHVYGTFELEAFNGGEIHATH